MNSKVLSSEKQKQSSVEQSKGRIFPELQGFCTQLVFTVQHPLRFAKPPRTIHRCKRLPPTLTTRKLLCALVAVHKDDLSPVLIMNCFTWGRLETVDLLQITNSYGKRGADDRDVWVLLRKGCTIRQVPWDTGEVWVQMHKNRKPQQTKEKKNTQKHPDKMSVFTAEIVVATQAEKEHGPLCLPLSRHH